MKPTKLRGTRRDAVERECSFRARGTLGNLILTLSLFFPRSSRPLAVARPRNRAEKNVSANESSALEAQRIFRDRCFSLFVLRASFSSRSTKAIQIRKIRADGLLFQSFLENVKLYRSSYTMNQKQFVKKI